MLSKSINLNKAAAFLDPGFMGEGIVDRFRVGCKAIGDGSAGDDVLSKKITRARSGNVPVSISFLDCRIDHWRVRVEAFMDAHLQYSPDT